VAAIYIAETGMGVLPHFKYLFINPPLFHNPGRVGLAALLSIAILKGVI